MHRASALAVLVQVIMLTRLGGHGTISSNFPVAWIKPQSIEKIVRLSAYRFDVDIVYHVWYGCFTLCKPVLITCRTDLAQVDTSIATRLGRADKITINTYNSLCLNLLVIGVLE